MDKVVRNPKGQAILEYIFVLSITVVVAVGMAKILLGGLDQSVLVFGGKLEKQLKSGRLSPGVWEN